jgi:hypothetical protein
MRDAGGVTFSGAETRGGAGRQRTGRSQHGDEDDGDDGEDGAGQARAERSLRGGEDDGEKGSRPDQTPAAARPTVGANCRGIEHGRCQGWLR